MDKKNQSFTERVSVGTALVFNIPAVSLFVLYLMEALKGVSNAWVIAGFLGVIMISGNVLMFGQKITATTKEISHRNSFFKTTTIRFKDGKPVIDIHTPPPKNGSGPLPRIRIRGSGNEISLHGRAFSRDIFSKLSNHIEKFGSPSITISQHLDEGTIQTEAGEGCFRCASFSSDQSSSRWTTNLTGDRGRRTRGKTMRASVKRLGFLLFLVWFACLFFLVEGYILKPTSAWIKISIAAVCFFSTWGLAVFLEHARTDHTQKP